VEKSSGELISDDHILKNITKSDNTYMISLNNFQARYFVAIKTNVPVNATLLLAKTSLNYI
jgi:hypothetical protein